MKLDCLFNAVAMRLSQPIDKELQKQITSLRDNYSILIVLRALGRQQSRGRLGKQLRRICQRAVFEAAIALLSS